ncbi:SHOCT domain-containing protein [Leuconostoc mesenteroides]|uniref:SHOCT domain-containing protein n=1 Tax=Leuconostoc mesenteroides TaxID=1245 RepID=UPI00235DFEEB|nr:SHOCT domain-containing protein [Leuconostoc mesenteroides]
MGKAFIVVKGRNGIVSAFEDRIEISRKNVVGFLTQGIKADRIIHYRDMTSIETKRPSFVTNGYMQFIINPELSVKQKVSIVSGTTVESMKDPNAVIFTAMQKKTLKEFDELKEYVLSRLDFYNSQQQNVISHSVNGFDDLTKLKSLLDDGVITQEDFDAKKKQILGI